VNGQLCEADAVASGSAPLLVPAEVRAAPVAEAATASKPQMASSVKEAKVRRIIDTS
jgi:hypothetical protein